MRHPTSSSRRPNRNNVGATGSGGVDIPIARRTQLAQPQRRFRFRQSLFTAGLLLAGSAALLWLFREPIKRQLDPPPVRGINVRQGIDGRLLGHFPYPEARASDLVDAAPGIALQRDAAESFLAMQRAAAADGSALRPASPSTAPATPSMWAMAVTQAPTSARALKPPTPMAGWCRTPTAITSTFPFRQAMPRG